MSGEGLLPGHPAEAVMSGWEVPQADATVTIDDASEPGAWAEAIPSLPSQQQGAQQAGGQQVPGRVEVMRWRGGESVCERFALSVMLRQRRLVALQLAEKATPGTEAAAIYADRVRQLEILTDEIEAGLHIEGEDG